MMSIAQQLLEFQAPDTESLELDRLILRIFEHPSLMAYLVGLGKSKDGQKVELDFAEVPDDAVVAVTKLIGPTDVEVLRYQVNGKAHVGFRFSLKALADAAKDQSGSEQLSA